MVKKAHRLKQTFEFNGSPVIGPRYQRRKRSSYQTWKRKSLALLQASTHDLRQCAYMGPTWYCDCWSPDSFTRNRRMFVTDQRANRLQVKWSSDRERHFESEPLTTPLQPFRYCQERHRFFFDQEWQSMVSMAAKRCSKESHEFWPT